MDKERGWFWYEQAPAPVESAPKPKAEAGQGTAKPVEVRMYEQFKAGMQEARIVAMFNPTQANVERYVQYRTALVKLADQTGRGRPARGLGECRIRLHPGPAGVGRRSSGA